MSVNNRFGRKVETENLELEIMIEMKIDNIESDHMKNIDSLEIKIAAITSNKKICIL